MGNIILYVHDLRTSGVVRGAIALARDCAARHRTTLVAGYGDGFLREEAARGGHALEILSPAARGPFPRVAAAPALRRWLKRQPPGLLVSMGNHGHVTPWLASRGLRDFPRIYRISNAVARGDGLRGRWRARWVETLVRDAARIAMVGSALGTAPVLARALAAGRAVAIANGVDIDRATHMAQAPSPHPWFSEEVPVVLAIGRLTRQKNFDLLIDAAALARRQSRLRLVILGGGTVEERKRLATRGDAAGLDEDFLLAGETDNVFAWLARAAVFALPSRWEGSSRALLEALAVGTPVVASAVAGDAVEVLGGGRYGRLFDGISAVALADAVLAQLSAAAIQPGDRAQTYAIGSAAYLVLFEEELGRRAAD
jgi:glycosyltransferase involved in cell wall biosynthesis